MTARVPWPHQPKAFQDVVDAIERGIRRICLTSVTGSGKSYIAQMLCEWAVARDWPVAILSNRKLLTNQLAVGLNDAGIHLGVRAADFESWTDHNAPVQVCSVPTEASRVINKRARAIKNLATVEEAHRDHSLFPAKLVICDESHLQKGTRTRQILDEYSDKYGAFIVGITATPLGIGDIYEELILGCNMTAGRACGALVVADCYAPVVMDLQHVYRKAEELPTQEAMEKATQKIWTQHIVGMVYEHWKRIADGRPSLGFAPGVKESLGLAHEFYGHGVNAAHISGSGLFVDGKEYKSTKQEDRDEIFARSKSGEIPICFNRFVLREAIDLPWIECISLATPIRSLLSFIQVVGRGLRACPSTGKKSCAVIDHCDNIWLHGSPNMDRDDQWITYFNEDEDKITRDRVNDMRSSDSKEPAPIICPECGAMRRTGPTCHKCGFEHTTSTRRIMQHDGTLVKSDAPLFPKRKPKMFRNTEALWVKCYWQAKNSKKGMTFSQARGLFQYKHHYCPPEGLPFMPKHKMDWTRPVHKVANDRLHSKDMR